MLKGTTIKEHLDKVRIKAHKTMAKNGHYFKMAKASVEARNNKANKTKA